MNSLKIFNNIPNIKDDKSLFLSKTLIYRDKAKKLLSSLGFDQLVALDANGLRGGVLGIEG